MEAIDTVLKFIERINQHDPDGLAAIFGRAGGTIAAEGPLLPTNDKPKASAGGLVGYGIGRLAARRKIEPLKHVAVAGIVGERVE